MDNKYSKLYMMGLLLSFLLVIVIFSKIAAKKGGLETESLYIVVITFYIFTCYNLLYHRIFIKKSHFHQSECGTTDPDGSDKVLLLTS